MEKRFEVVNEMRQHVALSLMALAEKQRRDFEIITNCRSVGMSLFRVEMPRFRGYRH